MMEARRWQSPAAAAAAAEEDAGVAGAGGPSRRPPRRGMHRSSPYGLGPRRWLSKLPVASRIFPAMPRDRVASDNNQEVHHESLEVIHEQHSAEPNTSGTPIGPPTSLSNKSDLLLEGDYRNPSDGNGLAEIEKMINQRHFSRDETERLIEIMWSRTPDLSVEDPRAWGSTAKGFEAPFSTPAKLIDLQPSFATDIFPPSNVHEVSSSPIEIAKAFMEAQTSASVHESQKRKFRALSHGVETENSAAKFFPKVATDSSVCWPGSVVRDHPNYLTPQSNKGRTLPQPFSRTPYSGSVFGRSIKNSRLGDTYKCSSVQSQLSTPFSVGSKTILEDKLALTSGDRVQPSSSTRGPQIDTFGATTSFPREGSAAMKNITFNLQGRPNGKGTAESSSTPGRVSAIGNISRGTLVSVHPKSSETAFKILQQLEKTIPSPTSKPLELRQALAKRNASSVVTNSQLKGPDSNISNGHRQSSFNESGSAHLEIADANKVPSRSPNAEESSQKLQSSGAKSEVPETCTSQHPLKSDLTSTSAAEVLDKNTSKGFSFTFPVSKPPSSLEPPPTPTLASPPVRSLPIETEDIPKFTFGSSSTTNKLVFPFDSTNDSVRADGTAPTFKLGSDKKQEFSFDIAGKDAVCF